MSSKPEQMESPDADATESDSSHQVMLKKKKLDHLCIYVLFWVCVESTQAHLRLDGVQVEGQRVKRENAENMLAEDREGTFTRFFF